MVGKSSDELTVLFKELAEGANDLSPGDRNAPFLLSRDAPDFETFFRKAFQPEKYPTRVDPEAVARWEEKISRRWADAVDDFEEVIPTTGRPTAEVVTEPPVTGAAAVPEVVGGIPERPRVATAFDTGIAAPEQLPPRVRGVQQTTDVYPKGPFTAEDILAIERTPAGGRQQRPVSPESLERQQQARRLEEGFDPNNPIGLREIETGLTGRQELFNRISTSRVGRLLRMVPDDPVATPAMAERLRVADTIDSQSNLTGVRVSELIRQAFDVDDAQRIPSLAGVDDAVTGAPTLADVAARLPRYAAVLTREQRAALEQIRTILEPYSETLRNVGLELPSRPDIIEGGFYIPRGNAIEGGLDDPIQVLTKKGGGKPGFERAAFFDSQAQGIDAGWDYQPVGEVTARYVEFAGDRATDLHLRNYFLSQTDEFGRPLAQSAADRISPGLRAQVQTLRNKISGRLLTRKLQATRPRTEMRGVAREQKRITDLRQLSDNAAERLESFTLTETTDEVIAAAERELRILDREVGKAVKRGGRLGRGLIGRARRHQKTLDEADQFRDELRELGADWKAAKERARTIPVGRGVIGLKSRILEGAAFPDEVANAANKVLRDQGPIMGKRASIIRVKNAVDRLAVGLSTTLDNSGPGIQGLLGLARRPKQWGAAMRVNALAWGVQGEGDRALGKFVLHFDETRAAAGRLTADQWVTLGSLRQGGLPELQLTEGLGGAVAQLPLVKQANRAFGNFGDAFRLEWADDVLREEMAGGLFRPGRTLDEIISSGDISEISKVVNGATGWSSGRAFGDFGDFLLFAPRFFQARLETVARSVMGLRPGATLARREARRSMLRLIGASVVLTYIVNEMRGEPTDFNPVKRGRYNSNFLRIRRLFGERDWSLLGTWDSLLRVIVSSLLGKPHEALRGLSAPSISTSVDLIAGENVIGEPTADNPLRFAETIAESFLPFASQELPGVARQLTEGARTGEAEQVAGGITWLVGEVFGGKSAPLSFTDVADPISRDLYGMAYLDLVNAKGNPDRSRRNQVRKLVEQQEPRFRREKSEDIPVAKGRRSAADPRHFARFE